MGPVATDGKTFSPRGAGTHSNGHCRRFSLHSLFIPIRGSCYAECGRRTSAVQIYEKIRTRNRRSENKMSGRPERSDRPAVGEGEGQLAGHLSASGGGKYCGKYYGFRTPRSPPQWFAGGQRTADTAPPVHKERPPAGGQPRRERHPGPALHAAIRSPGRTLRRFVSHTPRPPNPTGRRRPCKFGAYPCDGPKSSAAAMRSPSRDRRGTEPARCRSEDA